MNSSVAAVPADVSSAEYIASLSPENPFCTTAYFAAMHKMGHAASVLVSVNALGAAEGCGLFLRKGRMNTSLQIVSLPNVRGDSEFWDALRRFCATQGVTQLIAGTFGSAPGTEIPRFTDRDAVRTRCEYIVDLTADVDVMSSHHRRVVRKAKPAGLLVVRSRSHASLSAHHALMDESLSRRRERGENATPVESSLEHRAFLESGAGEIFQAMRGEIALSSILVLRSATGAYYHSAGTSRDGMVIGASHFLINQIAHILRGEGVRVFNLGGADPGSSLGRFKEGFGATAVPLTEVTAYLGPNWRRKLTALIELDRSDRAALKRLLIGDVGRMRVYAIGTADSPTANSGRELSLQALTEAELRSLTAGDGDFRSRQMARLERFGRSYAYAVLHEGRLAHISWMLPPEAAAKDPPHIFLLGARDAEITGCETLPEFRGKGIYRYAILGLVLEGRRMGIRRVFMKANVANKPSWMAIERAGLTRLGCAVVVTLPITSRVWILRLSQFGLAGWRTVATGDE